jgi:hypothetical protein
MPYNLTGKKNSNTINFYNIGYLDGYRKGYLEGYRKGVREAKIDLANNLMRNLNLLLCSEIANITGLKLKDVLKIKKKLKAAKKRSQLKIKIPQIR